MTTTSVSSNALLQQMQSLSSSLQTSSAGQSSQVSNFMKALEQVLTAGEELLSANISSSAGSTSTSSSSTSSNAASNSGTNAATTTGMLAAAQNVYTPTTAWSQATWDSSPYSAANNAAARGASQTVDGVQIIPGGPGWNPGSSQLNKIYTGIQSTWDSQESAAVPQSVQTGTGPNSWTNSAYNPANGAAARGASQTVNGVQVIPGALGWDPTNPALGSIYAGMQSTWTLLNSFTPTSS